MSTNSINARDATSATTSTEPAVSSSVTGNAGEEISLNVRTLDQKTYPISICSGASVSQLKERVAVVTGVMFARQRLIFRGKVLKNNQNISAYSLEDGHTLHLVARAEPVVESSADTNAGGAGAVDGDNSSSSSSSIRPADRPRRDNDEPDPTIGASPPSHVLMGATITVPEGSDMSVPFLSSMIANIMNSVQGSVATANVSDQQRSETMPSRAGGVGSVTGGTGTERPSSANRLRSRHSVTYVGRNRRRPDQSLRPFSSLSGNSSMASSLANLRTRSESHLETLRSNLEDAGYDFTGISEQRLDSITDEDTAFLQTQLTQLEILMDQFRTRMRLLPVALRQMQNQDTQPQVSVVSIVRAIDTLQAIGEAADVLARIGRYLFIRQTPGRSSENVRGDDEGTRRSTFTSSINMSGLTPAVHTRARSGSDARRVIVRPSYGQQQPGNGTQAQPVNDTTDSAAVSDSDALASLLERVNETIRSANNALASTSAPSANGRETTGTPILSESLNTQLNIPGLGTQLAPIVYPISLTELNSNSTSWNFAEFVSRLVGEIPASTMYGILTNDPVSVHQVMAHIGFALVSGGDIPHVSRTTIRTWSATFMGELRRQLLTHGIPATVMAEIPNRSQSSLTDALLEPLEPFIPELIDYFFRATSVSRTAAFGATSSQFFCTMARQFLNRMRSFVDGDEAKLFRILQNLLISFGLDHRVASFVVDGVFAWNDFEARSGSRRRERSESTDLNPTVKRRRE